MAHTWQRQRSTPQSSSHEAKSTHHPNTLSSLLRTTLTTILPLLFFTTLVIAGTIVLSYSLSLNQPVPARFVVGVSAALAALIGLSVWIFVWSRARGVWKGGKRRSRQGDLETGQRPRERRIDLFPSATETETEPEPEQTHTQSFQHQHQHQHAFHPLIPLPARNPNDNNTNPNPTIARPIPAYRGLPRPPPPRRASFELSAIPERSFDSDHRPSPPFTPRPAHYSHPLSQDARRPPAPYRSPSVASLPESLRAPGRGAETPRPTVASPASRSEAMRLPMPRVPEPLRFGASITGRGDGGGGGEGFGGQDRDERRRLVKVRGRGVG